MSGFSIQSARANTQSTFCLRHATHAVILRVISGGLGSPNMSRRARTGSSEDISSYRRVRWFCDRNMIRSRSECGERPVPAEHLAALSVSPHIHAHKLRSSPRGMYGRLKWVIILHTGLRPALSSPSWLDVQYLRSTCTTAVISHYSVLFQSVQ